MEFLNLISRGDVLNSTQKPNHEVDPNAKPRKMPEPKPRNARNRKKLYPPEAREGLLDLLAHFILELRRPPVLDLRSRKEGLSEEQSEK